MDVVGKASLRHKYILLLRDFDKLFMHALLITDLSRKPL